MTAISLEYETRSGPSRWSPQPWGSITGQLGLVGTKGWPGFFRVSSFKNRGPQLQSGGTSTLLLRILPPSPEFCSYWPWGPQWGEEVVCQSNAKQEIALGLGILLPTDVR